MGIWQSLLRIRFTPPSPPPGENMMKCPLQWMGISTFINRNDQKGHLNKIDPSLACDRASYRHVPCLTSPQLTALPLHMTYVCSRSAVFPSNHFHMRNSGVLHIQAYNYTGRHPLQKNKSKLWRRKAYRKKKASKLHWKCTLDYYLLVYSPDCKWPESSPLHNNRTSDNPYRCPGSRIHRRTCHTEYQWRLINTCTGRSHNCMCHQNQGPCH